MKKLFLIASTVLALTACGSDSDASGNHSSSNDTTDPVVNKPVVNKPVITKPVNTPKQCTETSTANYLNAQSVIVTDGDTIKITDKNGSQHRIRLLGIDAPETKQNYGSESTATLQECITDAIVNVEWISKDRYGRLLGKVVADGVDCNLEQVKKGAAWHYKSYQKNQTPLDQALYSNAEVDARLGVDGLWVDLYAVAPWKYRKGVSTATSHSNNKSGTNGLSDCYGKVSKDTLSNNTSHHTSNTNFGICSSMIKKTCGQMSSCIEAKQQLSCGNDKIDGNKDGVPCEAICR